MPIVLDDSILIPPSLRRGPPPRVYNVVQPGATTTTIIESSASHAVPHRPLTPPRSPVIIHQETTSYIAPSAADLDEFRGEVGYVAPGTRRRVYQGSESGMSSRSSRYRSRSIGAYDGGYEMARPRRYYDDEEDYYLEDGSRHGYSVAGSEYNYAPHQHQHQHHHQQQFQHQQYQNQQYQHQQPQHQQLQRRVMRPIAQAGLAAGALGAGHELYERRGRRRVEEGYEYESGDEGPNRHRGRKVAAVALGATAAGIAAHQIYKRRQSRARSSDSYTSSSDHEHHTGRKVAGAALGAAAAGIAAHKIRQRRRSRSGSVSSRSSSSDRESHNHNHRKAKIAAAAIGTGLAARHLHNRRQSQSRTRSRSRSTSSEREPWGRHIAAAALGATAAGLAHRQYKQNHQPERPRPILRRSYSDGGYRERRNSIFGRRRSPSPPKHSKLKKAAATAVAAAVAKKAIDHYREGRSRSRSKSRNRSRSSSRGSSMSRNRHHGPPYHHSRPSSRSRSRSRVGVPAAAAATMIGAAVAGERAHRKHKEKKRERELHGGGMAVPNGNSHHPEYYPGSSPQYAHPGGSLNGGGYAETIHSDSTMPRDNSPPPHQPGRSRRDSVGASLVDGLMDHINGSPDKRKALGGGLSPEAIAYKVGQTIGQATNAVNGNRQH